MAIPQKSSSSPSTPPAVPARLLRAMSAHGPATGTAGLPALVSLAAIRPHALAAVLILSGTASLAAVVKAVAAELPRLYWIAAYMRLVKKGASVVSSPAEVRDLMAGLSGARGVPAVPEPPHRERGNGPGAS